MTINRGKDFYKNNGLLIALFLMLLLFGLIYFINYKYQQSKIVLQQPEGFSIEVKTENITLAGVKWLESYNEQFYQKYLPRNMKIRGYNIEDIFILEKNIIQIDFNIEPMAYDEESAFSWNGSLNGGKIQCQWVLWFDKEHTSDETIVYTVNKLQRPAGYDLEKYNTSGEREKDEFEQEYINEIPFEEKQYTYKIENERCYVSFNGGNTWQIVPVDLNILVEVGDGNSYYNQLQEGSYIITPEKTAFVYGGTRQTDISITYSEDEGITWDTYKVNEQIKSTRIKFCSFPTEMIGYIIATGDRTMSQEIQVIYKTNDGGKTWLEMGYGPSSWLLMSGGFIDENIGFMSYPKIEGSNTNFYRTRDDGKSFNEIILPTHQEIWMNMTLEPFIQPETPYFEDNNLYLLVGQGPQGDFKGGTLKAKYKSEDMGETWTFIELIEPQVKEIG